MGESDAGTTNQVAWWRWGYFAGVIIIVPIVDYVVAGGTVQALQYYDFPLVPYPVLSTPGMLLAGVALIPFLLEWMIPDALEGPI